MSRQFAGDKVRDSTLVQTELHPDVIREGTLVSVLLLLLLLLLLLVSALLLLLLLVFVVLSADTVSDKTEKTCRKRRLMKRYDHARKLIYSGCVVTVACVV